MNPYKKIELKAKGWSEEEIRRAETILERAESYDFFLSKLAFWTALIVVIFANLIISLILIPFLVFFSSWLLFLIVILLGLTMGFVYNFLINNIKYLERKHQILAGVFLFIIALANMMLVALVSNRLIESSTLKNPIHSPWLVGIIFAVVFILPYIGYRLLKKF